MRIESISQHCGRRGIGWRMRLALVAMLWGLRVAVACAEGDVSLVWLPSPSSQTAGYALYYGSASEFYNWRVDVGTNTSATITNLPGGLTYFVVVTYDGDGVESLPSNEISYLVPNTPPVLDSTLATNGVVLLAWNTVPGGSYLVQFTTNLDEPDWQPLGYPIVADDVSTSFCGTVGCDNQRFYRILILSEAPLVRTDQNQLKTMQTSPARK